MGNNSGKRPQTPGSYKIPDVFHHDRGTFGTEEVPPPAPTTVCKQDFLRDIDFTHIDKTALNVSTDLLMETFWDIVEHMIVKKSFKYIDEVLRVRAIFRWMTSFDIDTIEMELLPPENSPIEYLINIQQDFGDHCHLFYALCQIANIPCVIINGMSKNMMYVVGDDADRELLDSRWNAVYIKDQWRLVDPYWAYSCIEDGDYDDTISIDSKGKIKRSGVGKPPRPINESYFLPDPKDFIYTHFPDDSEWQLLDKPWTLKQWQNSPYIREHFHIMEMKISSKGKSDTCILKMETKPVSMCFDIPADRSHNYRFAHNMSLIKSEHSSEGKSLRQFVMFEHSVNKLSYTIRVPFPGTFRLDIYGKDITTDKLYHLLCTYGIRCNRNKEIEVEEYPDCPHFGWGPNPYALESGVAPTPNVSVIQVDNGEFDMKIPVKAVRTINHRLKCKSMSDAELSRFTTGRFEKGNYLIHVKIPFDGEFALKIFAKLLNEPEDSVLTNILTFLIQCKNKELNAQPLPAILGEHLGVQDSAKDIGVIIPGASDANTKNDTDPSDASHSTSNNVNDDNTKKDSQGSGIQDKNGQENNNDGKGDKDGMGTSNDTGTNGTPGIAVNSGNEGLVNGKNKSKKQDDGFPSAEEMASGQLVAKGGILKLKFETGADVMLFPELCSSDDESSKMMTCEKNCDSDGNWIFELDMPIKGLYSFNLMGRNPDSKPKPIYSCLVTSPGHSFPAMLKDSNESKLTTIKHETIITQEPLLMIPAITDIREISTSLQSSTIPPDQLSRVARVVKQENELAVHLKFPGEFTLDIFKSLSDEGLTTLARYYIVRKFNPEIDQDNWGSMDLNALFDEDESDNVSLYSQPVTTTNKGRSKGTKKTIQKNIKRAMNQKDLDKLLRYMKVYETTTRPSTNDSISLEANQMIMLLQAQKYLDKACQSRQEGMLEDAVERARKAGLSRKLNSKIVVATRILGRIYKIDKVSKIVSKIDHKSLAELKKYQTPPNGVHQTLVAAFLLLGFGYDDVKDWRSCQTLLFKTGKENLMRRMAQFDFRTVTPIILEAVKNILDPYKAWQIRDVSKGAANVYLWVKGIIQVMEYQQGNVERCMSGKSVLSRKVGPRRGVLPEYSIEKNGTIIFESEEWYDSDDDW